MFNTSFRILERYAFNCYAQILFVYTIFGGIFGKKGTLLSFIVAIIFI